MSEMLELAKLIEERVFLGPEEVDSLASMTEADARGLYQDLQGGEARLIAKLIVAVRASAESS